MLTIPQGKELNKLSFSVLISFSVTFNITNCIVLVVHFTLKINYCIVRSKQIKYGFIDKITQLRS